MESSVDCNKVKIPAHAPQGSKKEHIHTFLLAVMVTGEPNNESEEILHVNV